MSTRIDSDLNIVLPVRADEEGNATIMAYHTPISRAIFEANYKLLAATKAALSSKGIHYQMAEGPIIAGLVLVDEAAQIARETGQFDADGKPVTTGANALLADIKRLTMVLIPTPEGWSYKPVDAAINAGLIDSEEWKEVESSIVFFTAHTSLVKRAEKTAMVKATASVLNAQSTSLSISEFVNSLLTSMKAETSEAKAA